MSDKRPPLGETLPPFMMILALLMVILRIDKPEADAWAWLFAFNLLIVLIRMRVL